MFQSLFTRAQAQSHPLPPQAFPDGGTKATHPLPPALEGGVDDPLWGPGTGRGRWGMKEVKRLWGPPDPCHGVAARQLWDVSWEQLSKQPAKLAIRFPVGLGAVHLRNPARSLLWSSVQTSHDVARARPEKKALVVL